MPVLGIAYPLTVWWRYRRLWCTRPPIYTHIWGRLHDTTQYV